MAEDGGFIPREAINVSSYLKELFSQFIWWPKDTFKKQLIDRNIPINEVKVGVILSVDDPVMKQQLNEDNALYGKKSRVSTHCSINGS